MIFLYKATHKTHAQVAAAQRGFTLVEILVTIGIAAILMAIAIPNYASWRQSTALRSATNALMIHLKQARHLAIAENRSVTVDVTATQFVFDQGVNASGESYYRNKTVSMAQFGKTVVLVSNFAGNSVTFTSRGAITGANGTICISSGAICTPCNTTSPCPKRITINGIGRARAY